MGFITMFKSNSNAASADDIANRAVASVGSAPARDHNSDSTAPFKIRLLKDASSPGQLDSLLPASYVTGPDDADIVRPEVDDLVYLTAELGQGRLSKLSGYLWVAAKPLPPRPLHYQRLLGREIIIAERMDLHLVCTNTKFYVKPIPRFLLEPCFWSRHLSCHHAPVCSRTTQTPCPHRTLWKSALGFLYSYSALICHESDFYLARENRLLPQEVEWTEWRVFVAQLDTKHIYDRIDVRFLYGEIRRSRLNRLQYWSSGFSQSSYLPRWYRYGEFFHDNFAWLASATIYIAIVLTAMQVGLATKYLSENDVFHSVSYGFTVFSIVAPVAAMSLIFISFGYTFVSRCIKRVRIRRLALVRQGSSQV